jgi:hypothetical protein
MIVKGERPRWYMMVEEYVSGTEGLLAAVDKEFERYCRADRAHYCYWCELLTDPSIADGI